MLLLRSWIMVKVSREQKVKVNILLTQKMALLALSRCQSEMSVTFFSTGSRLEREKKRKLKITSKTNHKD